MRTHLSTTLLLMAAMGIGFQAPAQARGWGHDRDVDIEIVDDRGHGLEQFPVRGDRDRRTSRAYLMAKRGSNYSIRVSNPTGLRLGLVIAVDGRNIISGEKSHLKADERMYVLGPHESAEYDGWRTSKNKVNRFYFTDAADSYAEAFNDDSAMGVIAVAVFPEREYRVREAEPYASGRSAKPRLGMKTPAPGTGYGESEWSPSRKVHFEPEPRPMARHFIKYEWRRTLCEKGIISCRPGRPHNRFWRDDDGFAPPPPPREHGWYGHPRY